MLVSALIRRVQQAAGFAVVVRKGDPQAGAILLECRDRGATPAWLERASDLDGRDSWRVAGPADSDPEAVNAWIAKRVRSDPDMWHIELDIADAQRLAAEIIGLT